MLYMAFAQAFLISSLPELVKRVFLTLLEHYFLHLDRKYVNSI